MPRSGLVWHSLCSGQGRFVATGKLPYVGETWRIFTTTNGSSWTERPYANPEDMEFTRMVYGNGTFIAIPGMLGGTNLNSKPLVGGVLRSSRNHGRLGR